MNHSVAIMTRKLWDWTPRSSKPISLLIITDNQKSKCKKTDQVLPFNCSVTTTSIVNIMATIASLNSYILVHVFSFLPLTSWTKLLLTCKQFYKAAIDNQGLFQTWCFNKFPNYLKPSTPLPPNTDYKWLLKCLTNDDTFKYGFKFDSGVLYIRQIINELHHDNEITVVANTIKIGCKTMCYQVGTFVGNQLQGQGYVSYSNGSSYHGEFINHLRHGLGTWTWQEGDSYHGGMVKGFRSGHGKYTHVDGSYCEGQWQNGKMNGNGLHHWPCGTNYVGQFKDNIWHGYGTYTRYDQGKLIGMYQGVWEDHVPVDCNFGYMFQTCNTCKLDVCNECAVSHHKDCKTKNKWASMRGEHLACGHEKQSLNQEAIAQV